MFSSVKRVSSAGQSSWLGAALGMALAASTVGCLGPEEAEPGAHLAGEDAVGSVESMAWTGWTSEEFPPVQCWSGSVVAGVACNGRFCDNVSIDCLTVSATYGATGWTPYFSEEGADRNNHSRVCGANQWVTGIACSGSYCDNLSLACTEILNKTVGDCLWTPDRYSEEDGPWVAPAGYYLRGMKCYDSYCDNKEYYYCRMQ